MSQTGQNNLDRRGFSSLPAPPHPGSCWAVRPGALRSDHRQSRGSLCPQRLPAHPARRHHYHSRGKVRDGPGCLYGTFHDGRRGARLRLEPRQGGIVTRGPRVLRPDDGRADDGRKHERHGLMGATPEGGGECPRRSPERGRPQTWGVAPGSLRTEKGRVYHDASGRSASYGELSTKAASLPVPADVALKDPKDFRIIGTNVKRVEGRDKVTGKAEFSIDVRLPGMLTAVVAHPPVCGGTAKSFDASKAMAVPRCHQSETHLHGCRGHRQGLLDCSHRARGSRDRLGRRSER